MIDYLRDGAEIYRHSFATIRNEADQRTLKLKSLDDIRALLARAGATGNREIVTYCAVGMRASLMYWAARAVGLSARVYVGSFEDWRRNSTNPIAREP